MDGQEAQCLNIARTKLAAGDFAGARRFTQKALGMNESKTAYALLDEIEKAQSSSPSGSQPASPAPSSSTTSARAPNPSAATTKARSKQDPAPAAEKRDYTAEQVTVVKRVKACKVTEYYEILSVQRTCTESEVKKAYRKLALALHPDKNGAPGADEAFKMVSKAFQILSDGDKRAVYDRSGGDPDSRASMSGGGGGAGMRSYGGGSQFRGGGFGGGEVNPEDLFNAFFGGGGGFGQGAQTFQFSNGGFRTTSFGNQPRRARPQTPESDTSIWVQLAPMLILLFFSLLSFLPSILNPPTPPPAFSFEASAAFPTQRLTSPHQVPYYVSPAFDSHPIGQSLPDKHKTERQAARYSTMLKSWEQEIETDKIRQLQSKCRWEMQNKERNLEAKRGFLGIGADWDEIRRIQSIPLETCDELKKFNLRNANQQQQYGYYY